MYVRFWGTRGSIASPGEHTTRYGGNTSCVEVRAQDGTVIVLDCGTGARELGLHLVRTMPSPMRLHLFIGHTHWDHIQGFPFFVPAFLPGAELNVYAPLGFQQSLEEAMSGQMEYSYFPVKLRDLRSRIHFTELEEGFFRVGDVLVETQYLNHTAPTIAYRMTSGGATVAYVTDHEPFWAPEDGILNHPGDQRHIAFMRGADLVIHDAQYTQEEYTNRLGWGHSTIEYATDVALAAGVKRLALFHHDPGHDDPAMGRLEAQAQARVTASGGVLDVFAAREGLELSVSGSNRVVPVAEISALRRRLIAGARVLVVTPDDAEVTAIEEALAEDGMVALPVPDMHAALTRGTEHLPDLAIVDTRLPPRDGADLVPALRSRMGRANFPVILLAERPEIAALHRPEIGATDYLARPYSPPMLRARVRAWLARTLVAFNETPAAVVSDEAVAIEDARDDRGATQTLLASMLASVPLFKCLMPAQLNALVAQATEQVYPGGHVIARQGEPPQYLWVLLSGRVRVVEATADGQAEMLLGEIGKAEVFGELGILRDQPRSATVIAVDRTHCLVLRHADFVAALDESVLLANGLLRVVAARLYDADRKLARYAPDPLTGLNSRRAFHEQYRRTAAGARRRKTGLLLLALDVLHLKAINDGCGYTLGDEVLRTVADALVEATRTTDVVARYGGDEFAVLLLDAMPKDVDIIVGRVRDKLAGLAAQRRLPVSVECSTGIAWSNSPPDTAEEFLREADRDMHERKVRDKQRRESA
ncbi:MAG TPA: diguanylate cyclase [Methylomirabilota bacterium]